MLREDKPEKRREEEERKRLDETQETRIWQRSSNENGNKKAFLDSPKNTKLC
jgi:hypothetical protein